MIDSLRHILFELNQLVQNLSPEEYSALTPGEYRLVSAIRTAQNLYDHPEEEDANQVELVMTCSSHPEQYDAYVGGKKVAYLRLRHGHFRVDFPDVGEETIYQGTPRGDGSFFDDERDFFLMTAKLSILAHLRKLEAAGG